MSQVRGRVKRYWTYLRFGFSLYLSFPLNLMNFLVVGFYLLVENIPLLKKLFPHFFGFMLVALLLLVPTATVLGWVHIRKSGVYATEMTLSVENNPVAVKVNRLGMEQMMQLCERLDVPVSSEFREFYKYWVALDERAGIDGGDEIV